MDGLAWPSTAPDWADAREQFHTVCENVVGLVKQFADHLRNQKHDKAKRQRTLRSVSRGRMAQIILAAVPAALSAWIMAANVVTKDATSIILPAQLQALVDGLLGVRSRHRQAQRRRVAGHLAPLTLERDWLFGVLPPDVTASILGRLDPLSRKALRATCRRTRLCVSSATTRILLDARGLRRFAIAPLHVMFPQLRELHLAGAGAVAAAAAPGFRWGAVSAGGAARQVPGGGGGVGAGGPGHLQGLLESGALAGLPALELLDISRWRRPVSCFTKQEWQDMVTTLQTHGGGGGDGDVSGGGGYGSYGRKVGFGSGNGGAGKALILRVDWRVLPLSSVWSPAQQLPTWREVAAAVKWLARKAPQVRLELEGPPLPVPSPSTLQAFKGPAAVRRLSVDITAVPIWALRRFEALSSLQGLRHLTLRLPPDVRPRMALVALRELHYLDQLSLPGSTLEDGEMQPLARLRSLRSLLVGALVLQDDSVHGGDHRPSLERLVVCNRIEVDPHVGLLPVMPALSALGVRVEALTQPLQLLPRPRPPQLAPQQPQPPQQPQQQQPLLQELLQYQLMQVRAPAAVPPPPPPPPDAWAPPLPAAAAAPPTPPQPPLPPVNLRELCLMYGNRATAGGPMAEAAAGAHDAVVQSWRGVLDFVDRAPWELLAVTSPSGGRSDAAARAADLAAQAAELPTLQRLRLWRCPSPGSALRLLTPVAERLQLPLVLLELHDIGPPEADRLAMVAASAAGRRVAGNAVHEGSAPPQAGGAAAAAVEENAENEMDGEGGEGSEENEEEGEGGGRVPVEEEMANIAEQQELGGAAADTAAAVLLVAAAVEGLGDGAAAAAAAAVAAAVD
ncbi:hypothetical protein VaNZ11_003034, partial [Volvox africanus]